MVRVALWLICSNMKIVHLKKRIEEDSGIEYLDDQDAFDSLTEAVESDLDMISFLIRLVKTANYYTENTQTAYGNPDYDRQEGWLCGYICAKKWKVVTTKESYTIQCGRKYKIIVDRVKKPKSLNDVIF